ncbi:MAG: MATE family efflux transporter [Lentisphaeria bacterium]|nr:MATE family efflux transporter [Lentisphaeria bacterium]
MSSEKKYEMDMCHGPLFGKVLRYAVPLMIANIAALLFHAADLVVLGQFTDRNSMAAVGAAGGFIFLMLNLFWGIGTGVNVLAARYTGARDPENVSRTVHTAIAVGLIGSVVMVALSVLFTDGVLRLMATPQEIMGKTKLYVYIGCAGIPFMIFYSFGSSVLRAVGDTKRPLIFMLLAGIANVLLNLFCVLILKMDVAGVGLATLAANAISAFLVLRALMKSDEAYKLEWKKVRIDMKNLKEMLQIGVPAGLQGAMFTVSNMAIQSTVNSFGPAAIAGNTAAINLESIVHTVCASFFFASISFTGQNYGGRKFKRIVKSIFICLGCSAVGIAVLGWLCILFGRELLAMYNPDPVVIEAGFIRVKMVLSLYFMCGVMDAVSGSLRGLGHSFKPALVIFLGVCVFRVIWVFTVFPRHKTMQMLFLSYPISWIAVSIFNGIMLYVVCHKLLVKASRREFEPKEKR